MWAKSCLKAPQHELTADAIVIITVCATLSVVAGCRFGAEAVCCSIFVCGNVVILVALALDEPWYIRIMCSPCRPVTTCTTSSRLPLDTESFARMAMVLGSWRPNNGQSANPTWMDLWIFFTGDYCDWSWWIAWLPFVGIFMTCISRRYTIKQAVMHTLPFMSAVLRFCILGAGGIGINRRPIGWRISAPRSSTTRTTTSRRPRVSGPAA